MPALPAPRTATHTAAPTVRMRVLRRDSYRCQYISERGLACLKPTASIARVRHDAPLSSDNLIAECGEHGD